MKFYYPHIRMLLLCLAIMYGCIDAYYRSSNNDTPSKCDCAEELVSFLALFSKENVSLGDLEAVKFDKVIENIGNGYNPATGKFTAPVSGIYSISVTIMSDPKNDMHLGIMKNNQALTVMFSHSGTYPQAANTLNISLKKGDTIWVQQRLGRFLHAEAGGPYNIFSGVLIAQI